MNTRRQLISTLFFPAAVSLAAGLVLADASVDPATQPVWSIGALVLKQANLKRGATNAYRTWFENGAWQGDVIEYDIDTAGKRSTDVDVGANPATGGTDNWSARFEFARQEATHTDYWKVTSGRKLITHDGYSQVAFRWDSLSAGQRTLLDPDTLTNASYDSPVLNFVRGDRSREIPDGPLRKRHSLLGDPGKVQPLYIGAPSQSFPLTGHAQYRADNANRAGRVIVAANDGMIHMFDAATGIEVYGYVPSLLFPGLNRLTRHPYRHGWFADGHLAGGDARIRGAWRTLVAAGLGAGARGLFALDVTIPTLDSETSTTADDTKILWEQSGDALGHIHGKPAIAPLSNGSWYVISGNGYGSIDGTAVLYMVPVNSGTPLSIATDNVTGNGLSAAALVDTDGDADIDIAYAGDLLGRLWKFDLNNPGTAAELLFAAGASRPITMTPEVAVHPHGGYMIYFATGSLLSAADAIDTSRQTVYAIRDYPNRTTTITDSVDGNGIPVLLAQTLSTGEYLDPDGPVKITPVRIATRNKPDWSRHRGWKTDLSTGGERVIGEMQLRGNRLHFVSHSPSKNNNPDGENWLLELDWLSGGDTDTVLFDLNHDGVLNNSDKLMLDDTSLIAPVGIGLGQGNRSQPTFARIANGTDILFINGVNLAVFGCGNFCADSLLDQLIRYTCSSGTGINCRMENGYRELEKLLEERVGDAAIFLRLKQYLAGGAGHAEEDSTGEIATDVDGSGDLELGFEYSETPTGRISWIDLRS